MNYCTIKSTHPLRPPSGADDFEQAWFWHWACLRRNSHYQHLYAWFKKNTPEDWTWRAWRQARLVKMIDPSWDEQRFIKYVRRDGGAEKWRDQVAWSRFNTVSGDFNAMSSEVDAVGAALNQEGQTIIQESEWSGCLRDDFNLLEILSDPKKLKECRAKYATYTGNNPETILLKKKFDNPARAKQVTAKLLERYFKMDLVVRTDWETKRILADVRRVIKCVKRWRTLAGLPADARVSHRSKALADALRIWDAVRKQTPDGAPKFDNKLLKKIEPTQVNCLNSDVALRRLSKADYKRQMDRIRSRVCDGFCIAEKAISASFRRFDG